MLYARLYEIQGAKIDSNIKYKRFKEEIEYKSKQQIFDYLQERYFMIEDLSDSLLMSYKYIFYCFDVDRHDNMIANMIGVELVAYE